ncbi:MAG: tRNA uridine-5-carboxymethylaminomethyl(34) synthesis enzyme MnmG, partial [Candidatus Omnitrophica bacterium]|nr:tRNA uridine-5-carboxymethylaminomethyl(34) synthesis enzyme MnmG [Candidatus Omnitrophota bacterium]
DDLTTKGTNEPYRMFTSRVEYRLILRESNADLRLTKIGYKIGLVSEEDYKRTETKKRLIVEGIEFLRNKKLKPPQINPFLVSIKSSSVNKTVSLQEILKRPHVYLKDLKDFLEEISSFPESVLKEIETEIKYEGFIQRQNVQVERFRNLEKIALPQDLDYNKIPGLSREIQEKLTKFKPLNLGQAARISGVTPSAITILMIYLKKINRNE